METAKKAIVNSTYTRSCMVYLLTLYSTSLKIPITTNLVSALIAKWLIGEPSVVCQNF